MMQKTQFQICKGDAGVCRSVRVFFIFFIICTAYVWYGQSGAVVAERDVQTPPEAKDKLLTKTARLTLKGHTSFITSVAFSPDGQTVLTVSYDTTTKLWNVADGSLKFTLKDHRGSITNVAFSPDGQTVLTGSEDNTARLWDVNTGQELNRFEGHRDAVKNVAFSPDGQTVLTGSADDTAKLWNVAEDAR